jgi:RNA polymerase sigma-70 factor, ECF subfamily
MRYSRADLEKWNNSSDEDVLRASIISPEVFEVLLERYEEAFLRKAKHIVYSHEDAQEVVQDTFTRIYIYADKFIPQTGASFSSWAYSILIHQCFTRYAKIKKNGQIPES